MLNTSVKFNVLCDRGRPGEEMDCCLSSPVWFIMLIIIEWLYMRMIMNAFNTMPHFMYMHVWGVSLVPPPPPPHTHTHTHKRTNEEELWITRLKTKSEVIGLHATEVQKIKTKTNNNTPPPPPKKKEHTHTKKEEEEKEKRLLLFFFKDKAVDNFRVC